MSANMILKGKLSLDQPIAEASNFTIVGDNTESTITTTDAKT